MTLAIFAAFVLNSGVLIQTQTPAVERIATRWAKDVNAANVHPEYPRPQMVRKEWVNLNGLWDFSYFNGDTVKSAKAPKILVPFPPESRLSGVEQAVPEGALAAYRRTFARPAGEGRVLLHFGAADYETTVLVNGKVVGMHLGGYDPFTFDITEALTAAGPQELVVTVGDPTDASFQPRGKQVRKPGGIFYTSTTGIWQTVWLEPVPATYIGGLRIETWPKAGQVDVTADVKGFGPGFKCKVEALENGKVVATSEQAVPFHENLPEDPGREAKPVTNTIKIAGHKDWSPENPFLYDLRVSLIDANTGRVSDQVDSYFGFREIGLVKNDKGQPMVTLNGKPVFLFGPLDQGFWPDGIYTAPTDEALKYDIQVTKDLGFNTIRKHVKVEPARWYYWCDKMGLLVLQDMPSGDKFIGPSDPDIERTPESRDTYYRELQAMIDGLYNHPSIICWVPFNEGWGQFETGKVTDWIKKHDPSRLVDSNTGWADRGVGDFNDVHVYPGPGAPKPEQVRASLLGEFGGLGLIVPGHTWQKDGWGYQSYKTKEELTDAMEKLMLDLRLLRASAGLSGAIYTQTTDVETELNGLMTYDRAMIKADEARLKKAIASVYKPAPKMSVVLPTSEQARQEWVYTTSKPADGWMEPAFSATGWKRGAGGFGTPQTPGAVVGTTWDSHDIWLRRQVTLPAAVSTKDLYLRIHHDDDVEVYLDGKLIWARKGWTTNYTLIKWPGASELAKGAHTLAVYCHQNQGGQFIDVGIVKLSEP